MWCIPSKGSAEFVALMENILDIYCLPYDPNVPVICMDEKPYQLLAERREPIPMKPGSPKKIDNEYERCGTCSIFVMTEPLTGWSYAHARKQRTAVDWAYEIRELLTVHFKDTPKIRLVLDNLNTHIIASLYKAFQPSEARELAKRLELHYTPKHGSWLNMAEIAISILSRQCLCRRINSLELLNSELNAWETERNNLKSCINWQFTNDKARIKLRRLYTQL
jgi:hypothetical protein